MNTYSDARTQAQSPTTAKDDGNEDLETDLRESRAFDDVIVGQEVSEQDGVATDAPLPDARLDQPTSSQTICYEEAKPTKSSPQEVLVETTDLRPEEHAMGTETPDGANVHDQEPTIQEGEMQFDDVSESDISVDEDWQTLSSATIDCPTSSEPATIGEVPPASPKERQRPVRISNRPTRYRDISFETRFQPVPRRRCKKIQRPSLTRHDAQNTEVRHELGRGADHKNIASTGNENARQKPPFCLKTSYPEPSNDLLATSRSLNNKRRRFLRKDKRQMKSTTLLYPPMNIRNKESSIETSTTRQERLRTAHLQLESTDCVRASNGRWVAVPREREAAEEVISAAAARRCRTQTLIDSRSATTASVSNRHPAVSNGESASVSVDRPMQSDDNSRPEISKHAESVNFIYSDKTSK